jgi:hypothetical protein
VFEHCQVEVRSKLHQPVMVRSIDHQAAPSIRVRLPMNRKEW